MLRIAFIPLLTLALFACERSAGSKLIGSWQGHTDDMGGQIRFAANHTFTSHEWDATNFVPDTGDWSSAATNPR